MRTLWWCDRCGECGKVEHDANADVMTVADTILGNHKQVSETCDGDKSTISVTIQVVLPNKGR